MEHHFLSPSHLPDVWRLRVDKKWSIKPYKVGCTTTPVRGPCSRHYAIGPDLFLDRCHFPLYPRQLVQFHQPERLAMEMKVVRKIRWIQNCPHARAQHNVVFMLLVGSAFMNERKRDLHGAAEAEFGCVDQEAHAFLGARIKVQGERSKVRN